ncbi:MAG: nucleoside monophosphate kinase [Rickettsiales bacterium]|nr:nucleoside monophosphate kinase [Rickettsiales bacterium]
MNPQNRLRSCSVKKLRLSRIARHINYFTFFTLSLFHYICYNPAEQKRKITKHEIIILLGIQGSGKGYLGGELRKIHNFLFIETGSIFRGLDKNNPSDRDAIKEMESGRLVSDEKTCAVVAARLKDDMDILTDGFPRSIPQAEWFLKWAEQNNFDVKVAMLNIPDEMVFERINNRVVVDGSRRPDDLDTESIKKRIAQYHEKTEPMIEFLRKHPGIEFFDIDGTRTRDEVFLDTASKLGLDAA